MCRDAITADRERHLQRCRRRLRKVCNADACGAGRLLQAIQRVPEGLELGACVTLSPFSQNRNLQRSGTCPGGTVVSAECADRSAFGKNPYACTALQELAALSNFLQNEAPWSDLANAAYCQTESLHVECTPADGVQLPTLVGGTSQGLAGALPLSPGDLGPSLTKLDLNTSGIASVPNEIAPLTGLQDLTLALNLNGLTGFPMGTPHHVPDLRPVALLRLVQERGLPQKQGRLQLHQSQG